MEIQDIFLATRNQGKIAEMRQLLEGVGIRVLTGADLNVPLPEIDEDADSLEGNARKKSEEVFGYVGIPTLADDTGLEVAALGGLPGVKSARYAGDDCDPNRNRRKLLGALKGMEDRSASFRTVVAFTTDQDQTRLFEGVCDGAIGLEERGDGGFGYDSIFIPKGEERTFAEMSPAEKNRISHRARALMKLRRFLEREVYQ
ncbi:MAG: RdgB/HAM1 family non-canonical purine NTP pyrophosphatase [Rhodothermia bacterium]|nr:RdgB/HAM1 family non-canonical purine NTP pyrophosphatase [Rhodothermia bacterium]